VKLTYSSGTLSETRHFYYTSDNQDIEERVGSSTSMDKQFVWGIRYVDELVCRDDATPERLYATQDANFNVTALISSTTGAVQQRFLYDPYGNSAVLTAAWAGSADAYAWTPRFTGQFFDPETQIYYYRARYYEPQMGVFVSRDPIEYLGGINLYEYAQSQPLTKMDPFGEDCCDANNNPTTDCCGPDITQQLIAIAIQMATQFFSSANKLSLAQSLINPFDAGEAWDSGKLRSGGVAGGGGVGGPYNQNCQFGTGKCTGTVTISGICYDDGAANYWIAGVIEQILLSWKPLLMFGLVGDFNAALIAHSWGTKGGPMKRAFLADGAAGTLGQNASTTTNDYAKCARCLTPANSVDWHWGIGTYNISGQA
jgi:RHS repeat-associated protein